MSEVNAEGETLEEFLEHYDETKYRRPSNTVDMILMTVSEGKLKLLLVKRGNHPFIHERKGYQGYRYPVCRSGSAVWH